MFINETTIKVAPGDVDAVVEILSGKPTVDMVMAEPAFMFAFVIESLEHPGTCTSYTIWQDAPSAQAFFSSPGYRELLQDLADMLIEAPQRRSLNSVYLDVRKMPENIEKVWVNISTLPFKAEDVPEIKTFLLSDALTFAREAPGYLFNLVLNPHDTPGVLTSVSMTSDSAKGRALFNSEVYQATLKDLVEQFTAPPQRAEYACHFLKIKEIPESVLVP